MIFQKDSEWEFVKEYYKDDPRPLVELNESFLTDKKLEALVTSRYFQSETLKRFYANLLDASNRVLSMLEEDD